MLQNKDVMLQMQSFYLFIICITEYTIKPGSLESSFCYNDIKKRLLNFSLSVICSLPDQQDNKL